MIYRASYLVKIYALSPLFFFFTSTATATSTALICRASLIILFQLVLALAVCASSGKRKPPFRAALHAHLLHFCAFENKKKRRAKTPACLPKSMRAARMRALRMRDVSPRAGTRGKKAALRWAGQALCCTLLATAFTVAAALARMLFMLAARWRLLRFSPFIPRTPTFLPSLRTAVADGRFYAERFFTRTSCARRTAWRATCAVLRVCRRGAPHRRSAHTMTRVPFLDARARAARARHRARMWRTGEKHRRCMPRRAKTARAA